MSGEVKRRAEHVEEPALSPAPALYLYDDLLSKNRRGLCFDSDSAFTAVYSRLRLRSPSSKTELDCLRFELSAARINRATPNATEKWKNSVTLDLDILLHVFLADKRISYGPVLCSSNTQRVSVRFR